MKKFIRISIILLSPTIISAALVSLFDVSSIAALKCDFLVQFLGIFLGFIFAILSFVYSMTESIKSQLLSNDKILESEKENQFNRIGKIHDELRDDTKFVFYLFCASILICFIENIDFPFISFTFSKQYLLSVVKLSILLLSILSIYEIMEVMFKVSKATAIFPKKPMQTGSSGH